MSRVDELVTELGAPQVSRDSDKLVLDTGVLVQELGQGSSVGLLFRKVVDGNFGTLPGDCDCRNRSQLPGH